MHKDIVVIGTSSGGIEALRILVGQLPGDLAASIFVVMHTAPDSPGYLATILDRAGPLPATCVEELARTEPGRIYVAAPDRHLLVEDGIARATRGPKENRFRPAIDPLFRSAALAYGTRVIGVILTGALDDGTAGLSAVKQLGGTAVVQDPVDALYPSMPRSALARVRVDHCMPLVEIAPLIVQLTRELADEKGAYKVPEQINTEVAIASEASPFDVGVLELGNPSMYACPECHGVLMEIKSESGTRFRCHTGHAYSMRSLMADIEERIDESLWNAIRAIEEQVLLVRQLAEHALEKHSADAAEQLLDWASSSKQRAELIRQAVLQSNNHKAREIS
jgi:two-component system, chemotaxis family, protein-glutamate methylesterase/glutaminase